MKKWEEVSAQDWEKFINLRKKELKKNGSILISVPMEMDVMD